MWRSAAPLRLAPLRHVAARIVCTPAATARAPQAALHTATTQRQRFLAPLRVVAAAPRRERVRNMSVSAQNGERPSQDYMSALEEEISQRPDAPEPQGESGAGAAAVGGITWHSAPTVGQVMTTDVLVLSDRMPLLHAMRALLARHVSGAPVVDAQGELVGMLSQGDVLRRSATSPREDAAAPPAWLPVWHALRHPLGRHGEADPSADDDAAQLDPSWLLEAPVSDAMTTDVRLTHPGALLTEAVALMTRHGVNRLPVLDHGRLVGIISRADVLAGLAGADVAAGDAAGAAGEPRREP